MVIIVHLSGSILSVIKVKIIFILFQFKKKTDYTTSQTKKKIKTCVLWFTWFVACST